MFQSFLLLHPLPHSKHHRKSTPDSRFCHHMSDQRSAGQNASLQSLRLQRVHHHPSLLPPSPAPRYHRFFCRMQKPCRSESLPIRLACIFLFLPYASSLSFQSLSFHFYFPARLSVQKNYPATFFRFCS